MDRETHLEECHTLRIMYQSLIIKPNVKYMIITDYLENKAISDLWNNVWKFQNYALYATEWKMSKNINTMKISVWHTPKAPVALDPKALYETEWSS